LQFTTLPYVYNINHTDFSNANSATIKYSGYIQYPFNLTNIQYKINNNLKNTEDSALDEIKKALKTKNTFITV
jgi:hypothetical protein